jgi:SAM-dependent methyltransferase
MGWYSHHVVPRLVGCACGTGTLVPYREQTCSGLRGQLVEVGFGTGLNVELYPDAVTSVAAVEPEDLGWRLASERIAEANVPIERVGVDGASIPLADASCDSALSTWTLCTITRVEEALHELRRVLKPGGELHFVEHGHSDDPSVQRWQRRLEPLQKRLAGGCHLTRDIPTLITDAGFEIVDLDTFTLRGTPKTIGTTFLGRAVTSGV